MKKTDIFWQTYLELEKGVLEVAKFIYITDEKIVNHIAEPCSTQLNTFSPHIADLIIRTCIEIESISKELYFELGGTKARGDKNLFFDEDCLKLIDIKCKTHIKNVFISCLSFNLTKEGNKVFKPLKNAHKRQGTDWEKAYQALKHDRFSSLHFGTIKNLLHAMGALYLLNLYYREPILYSKYLEVQNLDYSFGSAIFSVQKPSQKFVIDVINGRDVSEVLIADESPFVLKYSDSSYKAVIAANEQSFKSKQEYLAKQPELREKEFIDIINEGLKKQKENPQEKFIIICELFKYRINKKFPKTMSFENRKQAFITSEEWNGRIRKQNNHLSEQELTEDNLQNEIDLAGFLMGMELEQHFYSDIMKKSFTEGYCEILIDKGNIKYSK